MELIRCSAPRHVLAPVPARAHPARSPCFPSSSVPVASACDNRKRWWLQCAFLECSMSHLIVMCRTHTKKTTFSRTTKESTIVCCFCVEVCAPWISQSRDRTDQQNDVACVSVSQYLSVSACETQKMFLDQMNGCWQTSVYRVTHQGYGERVNLCWASSLGQKQMVALHPCDLQHLKASRMFFLTGSPRCWPR